MPIRLRAYGERPVFTGPAIFFQIAAALLPALVLAGWLSDAARPHRLLRGVSRSQRLVYLLVVVLLLALIVTAEFFAIVEAVSGSLIPSKLHTIVVAEALAVSTVVLAVVLL